MSKNVTPPGSPAGAKKGGARKDKEQLLQAAKPPERSKSIQRQKPCGVHLMKNLATSVRKRGGEEEEIPRQPSVIE